MWQNFIVLLVLGFIGYLFKKNDWPRAPFVVGIVLGPIAESSLHKAMAIWGYSFLARPLSLVMLALIIGTIALNLFRLLSREDKHAHS